MGFDAPPIGIRTAATTGTPRPAAGQPHIELSLEEGQRYVQLATAALTNTTTSDIERHHEFELTDVRQQIMTGQIVHADEDAAPIQTVEIPINQDFSVGDTEAEATGPIQMAKGASLTEVLEVLCQGTELEGLAAELMAEETALGAV